MHHREALDSFREGARIPDLPVFWTADYLRTQARIHAKNGRFVAFARIPGDGLLDEVSVSRILTRMSNRSYAQRSSIC